MSKEEKDIGKIMEEMLNRPLELIEENKKLKKKIDKLQKENEEIKELAIDIISEIANLSGSCPLDSYNWRSKKYENCKNCNNTFKECYIEYFLEEVRKEK